jgi:hypothetical protein
MVRLPPDAGRQTSQNSTDYSPLAEDKIGALFFESHFT